VVIVGLFALACTLACKATEGQGEASPSNDRTTAEICAASLPSIATVYVDGGRAHGSAFYLGDQKLITAAHVVAGADLIQVCFTDESRLLAASVVAVNTADDLAELRINHVEGLPQGLKISLESLGPGESVLMIGAPEGLEGTVTQGLVSAVRMAGDRKLYQLSIPVALGSSGSPILDDSGRVVGILISKHLEAEGVGFAASVNALERLDLADRDSSLAATNGPGTGGAPARPPSAKLGDVVDFSGLGIRMRLPSGWQVRGGAFEAVEVEITSDPRQRGDVSMFLSLEASEVIDPWMIDQQSWEAGLQEAVSPLKPEIEGFELGVIGGVRAVIYSGSMEAFGDQLSLQGCVVGTRSGLVTALALLEGSREEKALLSELVRDSLLTIIAVSGSDGDTPAIENESTAEHPVDGQLTGPQEVAQQLASHLMDRRYQEAARMLFPPMLASLGGINGAARVFEDAMAGRNGLRIQVMRPSSRTAARDRSGKWYTLVLIPTLVQFQMGPDLLPTRIDGWLLAIREDGGEKWSLVEGSDDMSDLVREQFGRGVAKVVFPTRRMFVSRPDGSARIEFVEQDGEFVPGSATKDGVTHSQFEADDRREYQELPSREARLRAVPYRDPKTGLSVRFPRGWTVKPGASDDTVVKAVNPDKRNSIDLVAVAIYDLGLNQDLWEFEAGEVVKAMARETPWAEVSVLEGGRIRMAGGRALWSVTSTKTKLVTMHNLNYVFMRGEKLFWVYGATDGGLLTLERMRPLFRESIETCVFSR